MNLPVAFFVALAFCVLAVLILMYMILGKASFFSGKYRPFCIASCLVYLSGLILALIFTLLMKGLPVAFVLVSDITVTCVFAFTIGLIIYLSKAMEKQASGNIGEDEKDKK